MQSIRECGDNGTPAVLNNDVTASAFTKLAEILAQQVAIRNATMNQTERVEIKTV